jgi:phage gp45-like
MKSIGDSYELSAKGKNIYAKGDVNIVSGGTLNIWAESNVNITPNDTVVITGDLKVTGEVTVDGNVMSKSDVRTQTVSLNLHKHQESHGIITEPIPTWQ